MAVRGAVGGTPGAYVVDVIVAVIDNAIDNAIVSAIVTMLDVIVASFVLDASGVLEPSVVVQQDTGTEGKYEGAIV